ncbi:MAG: MFS transporter [Pseudomonadales bacterium]
MNTQELGKHLSLAVLGTITLMQLLALPAMVGVITDGSGLTEQQAGVAASAKFFGGALVALLMAFQMHRLPLRSAAMAALLLAAAADFASAYSAHSFNLFLFARFCAGIGTGIAYVATIAAYARSHDPERGYGIFVTLQFTVSGLALYVLPVYSSNLGVEGMFLIIAGLDITALLFCGALPKMSADKEKSADHLHGIAISGSSLKVLTTSAALFGIIAFGLYEAANTAQFTYIERLGVAMQFSEHEIGRALLIASFIGIPGAFSVVLLGGRFGHTVPIIVGITVAIIGLVLVIMADSYSGYFMGGILLGFSWAFCLPFIQGLLAGLDRTGGVLAAGSFCTTVGATIGPYWAARLIDDNQYDGVFIMAIGLFAIAALFFVGARPKSSVKEATPCLN